MKVNFLFEYEILSGFLNMEKDLSMLERAILNRDEEYYVRFYGWSPRCVSLGRNQKDFKTDIEIDIVRRPTGGRALLHDKEITYCIAGKIPDNQSVIQTYKMIADVLTGGFKNLGVELSYGSDKAVNNTYCMNVSTGADICFKGKKLIGSAQFRKEGYFLQHGSILKSLDCGLIERVFKEKPDKNKITTLSEIGLKLTDEEIIDVLKKEFVLKFGS